MMNMMRGGNRQMRRMMDKMGLDMEEIPNVQEVIIKTDKKEIIIPKPSVTEMKSKENSIFQVIAESFEEKELEVPIFSEDDIMLVCQQANCDEEKAKDALAETKGDIAQTILRLTSGWLTKILNSYLPNVIYRHAEIYPYWNCHHIWQDIFRIFSNLKIPQIGL